MNALFKRILFGSAAVLALLGMAVGELPAATVTPGFDPAATLQGAVRYRAFNNGNQGIRVGLSDGSGGITDPAQGNVNWGLSGGSINKAVTFSYNGTNTLTATVAGSPTISKSVGSLGTLNYLEITITRQNTTGSVSLNNVVLGGDSLGNFSVSSTPNTQHWKVTDINLTTGFTLTGSVVVSGLSGGGDSNFVQIDVGSVPPSDTEGPEVTSIAVTPVPVIINGEATVHATIDDTDTGGNYIASAEYSLNDGPWIPMDADDLDGFNNEVVEDVKATFTAYQLGENEVCVRGTDSLGNTGDELCQTFLVTYKFEGFFSPIENDPFLNMAKAGQAIPVKWRLTDANDVPIDDPASFVNLSSYQIDCEDFQGDPSLSVEEIAAGKSGLQYNGDGYWQFNWKTPKTYANTCRAMYIEFNSGALSPVAKFQFKK